MSRIAVLTVVAFGAVMAANLTAPLAAQGPASRLKVYCFTGQNASGFVDQSTQARLDSLKDLKEAIVKKKDWLQLVEAESQADVTVEVVERVLLAAGRTNPTSTSSVNDKGKTITTTTSSRPITNYALRTVMRVGSYENPMEGVVSSEYLGGQWRAAAGQVAGEIEKWAKANQGKLRTAGPSPQPAGAAPNAAATAPRRAAGPRQTIIDWYLAPTVEAAEAYLLKTTLSQVQAFRTSATPEQATIVSLVDFAIAPGPSFTKMGQAVSAKGQPASILMVKGEPADTEMTFQPEAIAGDRAFVPVSVKYSDKPTLQTGTFELTREDGAWRIASIDLGQEPRLPRLDGPKFVGEFAALVVRALEKEQTRLRDITALARVRMLAIGEFTFSSIHGGYYAPRDCVEKPRLCAPADPPDALILGTVDVTGYSDVFHPGPAATAADLRASKGLRRGLKSWAFTMTPTTAGPEAGAYCADSNGRVCKLAAGAEVKIAGAACPATCQEVK